MHHSEVLPYRERVGPALLCALGVVLFVALPIPLIPLGVVCFFVGDVWINRRWQAAVRKAADK